MKISIIGTGRVAHHLAQKLNLVGQTIVQIYGRDLVKAQALADRVAAQGITDYASLQSVDLVVIAVSDSAIADVIDKVHRYIPDSLIVHTSGSTELQVLSQKHQRSGVFYPLQTFSLQREIDWLNTPIFVEAVVEADQQALNDLAQQLSDRVYIYSSQQRLSLHLAAVFACNFSNYCYDLAKQIIDQQQVDFSLLYPLMLETAYKATQHEPQHMQTGPAMRGDKKILNLHQAMLSQQPELQRIYRLMSDGIMQRHHSEQSSEAF
ncbi:Rossmann-like and DUF2520 domain-containing protein [Acinetobacter sp. GSS19]|uniref:Rossmann-like and DUF2520 domain-containing protein n=1 Tax=Acinetobacter sp. GSS19 TaxID=3020716 RepID=UPI00235ECE56|nr:Rossmann-like and DUF2520 domain-containing protein [Acinetobacter sp. GSS19]